MLATFDMMKDSLALQSFDMYTYRQKLTFGSIFLSE